MKNISYLHLASRFVAVAIFSTALAACSGGSKSKTNSNPNPGPEKPAADTSSKLAPSNLLEITDAAPASTDRETLMAAIKRADQENKTLVLDVTAAWCGPCQQFNSDFEAHPEYLKDMTEQNVIFAKAEYEKVVYGSGLDFLTLSDYLPMFITFFPSFLKYEKGQWKLLGSYSSYKDLKEALTQEVVPYTYAELIPVVKDPAEKSPEVSSRLYASLFGNYQSLYTYKQALTIINTLNASENAELKSYAGFMQMFMPIYVGIGAVSTADFTKDFPDMGKGLIDASAKNFSTRLFNHQLQTLRREKGMIATAAQCPAHWQAYRSQIQQGSLTTDEFAKKLADLDHTNKVVCAHLDWEVNGVTPKLKSEVASLDKNKIDDWALLVAVGEVDAARAAYDRHYQPYVKSYESSRKTTEEELTKAEAEGDLKKVEKLKSSLELQDFRSNYHAEVNKEVQDNISCAVKQTAVKVLN